MCLGFFNLYPCIIINDRGTQDQEDVFYLPAHIEIVAGSEQKVDPELMGNDKVQDDYKGKKYYKLYGIKKHILSS